MWKFEPGELRKTHVSEYLIRFLFGGSISVLAALIAKWSTGQIGGLFTAFPAILLASLTLINREDGKRASIMDARGAVIGSIALVLTAILLSFFLGIFAGGVALLLGLIVWLIISILLYMLSIKAGWIKRDRSV